MIGLFLVIAVVAAVYVVRLRKHPMGPCGRCRGTGKNAGSSRKQWGACKTCAGTGTRQRLGARVVHRWWWSIAGEAMHERRKERVKAAREKAGYLE